MTFKKTTNVTIDRYLTRVSFENIDRKRAKKNRVKKDQVKGKRESARGEGKGMETGRRKE